MSFLDHLDELRRRLVWSVVFVGIAFIFCWFVSDRIYNFLSVPVRRALSDAQSRQIPISGKTGEEKILPLGNLKEGDSGRFVFQAQTKLGAAIMPIGTSVLTSVSKDSEGNLGLFTEEEIYTSNAILPKGVRLPFDFTAKIGDETDENQARMIVTTAAESFTLYVTVSLYAALALSIPFLLLQIWIFISPALYQNEKGYVTPFIFLSTVSFILGAAVAYYFLFPPAVRYLLGLGKDFNLMLRASDYFDFITLIMFAMGVIFQMPAITYVLARIGLVTAGFMIKAWKMAIMIILLTAAVISPTGDIPNLFVFATPMMALYLISIFVAWVFGKKRQNSDES